MKRFLVTIMLTLVLTLVGTTAIFASPRLEGNIIYLDDCRVLDLEEVLLRDFEEHAYEWSLEEAVKECNAFIGGVNKQIICSSEELATYIYNNWDALIDGAKQEAISIKEHNGSFLATDCTLTDDMLVFDFVSSQCGYLESSDVLVIVLDYNNEE